MSLKQINVKQAERWLQKLKNQNMQSYKDITKFLRKYEKTEDEYDCYVKISHTLLAHSELTKELNGYMEEVNKFVVNKPEDQKIKEFMAFVKKSRPDVFERIIHMIQDLSKSKGENPIQISKSLRPRLRDIVDGDPELQRITEQALDLTGEELINRKNLDHLKITRTVAPIQEEEKEVTRQLPPKPTVQKTGKNNDNVEYGRQAGSRFTKPVLIGPFTNPSQERGIIRQIEKMVDEQTYGYIIKVIKVFYLNIITRNEAFQLLAGVQADDLYLQCLRDILDSRENERRKVSCFRPLNDMNFSNYERASPSYVAMPPYYPIRSAGKAEWIKGITNENWVSVPHGSEESENFSVRNKNSNEINLLKAEDERYEFDLYMRRLTKTLSLLDEILEGGKDQREKEKIINCIIEMGTLQLIYKNCHREQREELEWMLGVGENETCKLFRQRVFLQVNELKNIKEVHANKNWNEVATKNFFKALDLKGFEYKKNQKQKMKATFFISELQQRYKLLQNGGQSKNNATFEEKKQFFTVLNSFESSSRTEKCSSRQIPQIESFDMKDQRNRHLYPLIILTFQEKTVCQNIYSLLLFYIDNFQMAQPQKIRCKMFLEQYFIHFLKWNLPNKQYLNQNFDQEKFYAKLNGSQESINLKSWLSEQKEQNLLMIEEKDEQGQHQRQEKKNIKMGFLNDNISCYSYLPNKAQGKSVLYGSQHFYTFNRFIYALYQRLIKMREVAESPQKINLFLILFYSCIKTKQGNKFEQNLNLLFSKHAYLFSTLYKLFDNLIKSLCYVSSCPLMNYSFKCCKEESQDIYFVLLNRFCLSSNLTNSKLVRLTYNQSSSVIYFNYLDSYYKSDEFGKDIVKKRSDIAKGIEIYTVDSFGLADKKKRKLNQVLENNEIQYIFEGSTIKMLNHLEHEDLMYFTGKRGAYSKNTKRELKRAHRFMLRIN